ncbi:MAG: hypothetical protein O2856_13880 [Planctomycetota bacterium]|nr:hypothetical protein [Planctomycetota bacterium]
MRTITAITAGLLVTICGCSDTGDIASPPASSRCVGTWECSEPLPNSDVLLTIQWSARSDGLCNYVMTTSDGRALSQAGTWSFSDGVLYEVFEDGSKGKASVVFPDENTMRLTILDNGVPDYTGRVRDYRRVM